MQLFLYKVCVRVYALFYDKMWQRGLEAVPSRFFDFCNCMFYQLLRVQHSCSSTQSWGSVLPSIVETRDQIQVRRYGCLIKIPIFSTLTLLLTSTFTLIYSYLVPIFILKAWTGDSIPYCCVVPRVRKEDPDRDVV